MVVPGRHLGRLRADYHELACLSEPFQHRGEYLAADPTVAGYHNWLRNGPADHSSSK